MISLEPLRRSINLVVRRITKCEKRLNAIEDDQMDKILSRLNDLEEFQKEWKRLHMNEHRPGG